MSAAIKNRGNNILEMSVDNIGFLLDRLGQDCHPLQFLRELTQNSIEAIQRTGKPGEIVWDADWTTYELDGQRMLLSVTDTGDGMTGDEMIQFINQLSSSVQQQSLSGNYGVGAKIAAATRNHAGVVYLSWKEGDGSMIHLYRDKELGKYGLKQFQLSDGSYSHHVHVEDAIKPDRIESHGTKVVLYGKYGDINTMNAPENVPSPSRWVSKYLNTRYFKFPEGVTVRAREGWQNPLTDKDSNILRKLVGQKHYLNQHAEESGHVDLSDAKAHWWILKDESALGSNSGFIESSGHVAALYQDELYEYATGRGGMAKLQQFGVIFGYRQVVIYVEPDPNGGKKLTSNTARTTLLIDNEPLPWSDWAEEFREDMPKELEEFIDSKAGASENTDHSKSIRDRLKDIMDLFKLSRYKPSSVGEYLIDDEQLVRGGSPGTTPQSSTGGSSTSSKGESGGAAGNVYAVFEKADGTPGKKVRPEPFPEVKWISLVDRTREYGMIEDRAAKFLTEQNLLLINGDFRVFADMVSHVNKEFGSAPGVSELATSAVRAWFEQALVETIIGVQSLMNSKEWSPAEIETALSEEGLTSAVMQRYHIHNAVKRHMGSKLGQRRSQPFG